MGTGISAVDSVSLAMRVVIPACAGAMLSSRAQAIAAVVFIAVDGVTGCMLKTCHIREHKTR